MKPKPLPKREKAEVDSLTLAGKESTTASSASNAHKGHLLAGESLAHSNSTPSTVSETVSENGTFSVTGRLIECSRYESRNGRGFALLIASSTGAPYSLALAATALDAAAQLKPGLLLTVSGKLFSHVSTGTQGKPFYGLRTAVDAIQIHKDGDAL
jgi:hypothetical protein